MLEKQWLTLMGVKCRGLPHSAADTSVTQPIFFRDPATKRYRNTAVEMINLQPQHRQITWAPGPVPLPGYQSKQSGTANSSGADFRA